MTTIRPILPTDMAAWLHMRRALWPHGSEAEHAEEIVEFFAGRAREPLAVLLAIDAAGQALGFVELSIRSHAEGCESDQVAYLEGWYVVREARGRGVGRALESAAEDWARSQGCRELASDTEHDNKGSAAAHKSLGFTEVGVVRCFRKQL